MFGNLDPIVHRAERVVIVLVGLIASGKVCSPLLFRVVRVSLRDTKSDIPFLRRPTFFFHMLWRSKAHGSYIRET
jgi:hypothetical protein